MYTKSDILKQDYYKISKAAEFMGISSQTLRKRIDMGLVPCLRSENKYRLIPAEAIVEYLYNKNMLLPEPEILKHDVIYARVSTRKQEKRGDLERQITNIKLFAVEQNVKNLIVTSDVIRGRNVYWYDGSSMDRDRLAGLNMALRGKNNARGKKIPVRNDVKSQRVKRKSSRSVNKELKQAYAVYHIKANEKDKYDTVYLSPQQEGQVYDYGTSMRTHSSAYRQEPDNHFSEKGLLRMPRIKEYADIATLSI